MSDQINRKALARTRARILKKIRDTDQDAFAAKVKNSAEVLYAKQILNRAKVAARAAAAGVKLREEDEQSAELGRAIIAKERAQKLARQERQRADQAEQERDQVKQRADQAKQRADQAEQQADQAEQQADQAEQQALEALRGLYGQVKGKARVTIAAQIKALGGELP